MDNADSALMVINDPTVITTNVAAVDIAPHSQLSKRQLKKMKKQEQWRASLPERRAKERMRMKLRKQEARKNNITLGPTRKQLKMAKMSGSPCKLRLALDFSFDDLMEQRDLAKCIKQVQRCYCFNRRANIPVQFYIVNLNGKAREEMNKLTGYENWDVNIHHEKYSELFANDELVYLTSESDNVIQELDENKVYIIGALVDHNSQKGLCLRVAEEQKIYHGRLPISEYLNMKSRKVLAINHVFEIMVNVCNGVSWEDAMLATLPQRKGAVAKESQQIDVADKSLVEEVHTN